MAGLSRFVVVTLVALAAGAASAARAPRPPEKGSVEAIQAAADQMAAECKLTADQQATLKEKVKAKVDALEAWLKVNGEKLKAAQDAAKAARAGTDDAAKKKAGADLKALETERDAALAQADAAILAILTPEQKADWDASKLYQTTIARYKKANPTEEQQAKIKAVCKAAAAELAGLKDDDKKAKQTRAAVPLKLRFAIEEAILTPEQKAAAAPPPKPAAKPEAAPPAAAPAAAPPAEPDAAQPAPEKKPEGESK
jgi:Spy/CpxP family protein refolding chaperone